MRFPLVALQAAQAAQQAQRDVERQAYDLAARLEESQKEAEQAHAALSAAQLRVAEVEQGWGQASQVE